MSALNITSSYQVRIVNCSVNLNETVRIYRKALAYLIGVVNENWDAVKRIDTGTVSYTHLDVYKRQAQY